MDFSGSVAGSVAGMLHISGEGDDVNITRHVTTGTKIATFTLNEGKQNEETIDLYAPDGFSGSWNDLTDKPDLFSGSYNDLTNKPSYNGQAISGNIYSHNYSYQEHVVGRWVDGRLVYEKTIPFGAISGQTYSLDIGLLSSEIDFCLFVPDGSFANNGIIPLPYVIGRDNTNNIGGYFNTDGQYITFDFRIGGGMAGNISGGVITIRYVKKATS